MNFPEFWQNFDRILMWKVRMVRSVADRTFQPLGKDREAELLARRAARAVEVLDRHRRGRALGVLTRKSAIMPSNY